VGGRAQGALMDQRLRSTVSEPILLMFSRRQVETCDVDEPLEFGGADG